MDNIKEYKVEDSKALLDNLVALSDHFERYGRQNQLSVINNIIDELNSIGIRW